MIKNDHNRQYGYRNYRIYRNSTIFPKILENNFFISQNFFEF